jgi:hypothetical protein
MTEISLHPSQVSEGQASHAESAVWQHILDYTGTLSSEAEERPLLPAELTAVRAERGVQACLRDDLGLSSLQVLEICSRIAAKLLLETPPSIPITDVRTVGDLCGLFEGALRASGLERSEPQLFHQEDGGLSASLERAAQRRRRRSMGS